MHINRCQWSSICFNNLELGHSERYLKSVPIYGELEIRKRTGIDDTETVSRIWYDVEFRISSSGIVAGAIWCSFTCEHVLSDN